MPISYSGELLVKEIQFHVNVKCLELSLELSAGSKCDRHITIQLPGDNCKRGLFSHAPGNTSQPSFRRTRADITYIDCLAVTRKIKSWQQNIAIIDAYWPFPTGRILPKIFSGKNFPGNANNPAKNELFYVHYFMWKILYFSISE